MENDSVNPVNPTSTPLPVQGASFEVPAGSPVSNLARDRYEIALFILGTVAIISLLFNVGPLLQVSAGMFLVIAIISILRSLRGPAKPVQTPVTNSSNAASDTSAQPLVQQVSYGSKQQLAAVKRWSPLKIIGTIILLIVVAPILFYAFIIIMFIIMLMAGGGKGS